MPLTSSITAYDPAWPQRYEEEAARLTPIFGAALIGIHHVGSTAVPGLAAKPEIDVLVIVNRTDVSDGCVKPLQDLGYRRGGDLSQGHHFFKRDKDGVRTHKIHVCLDGHPAIGDMLKFRDHLRSDETVRARYEALKLELEKDNSAGIGEYLNGKKPFIQSVLATID